MSSPPGDARRRGNEQRIDEAATREGFPKQKESEQRPAADRQTLVRDVKPCNERGSASVVRSLLDTFGNGHRVPGARIAL